MSPDYLKSFSAENLCFNERIARTHPQNHFLGSFPNLRSVELIGTSLHHLRQVPLRILLEHVEKLYIGITALVDASPPAMTADALRSVGDKLKTLIIISSSTMNCTTFEDEFVDILTSRKDLQ